MSLSHRWWS